MFKKAMEALEQLSKAENPADELDALTKALQKDLGTGVEVVLRKSGSDDEAEAEKLRKAKEAEEEVERLRKAKEAEEDAERLRKSQQHQPEDDELLIEASEAYHDLQKSVQEAQETTLGELDVLKKSLGSLLNLTIKLAGVVGELSKSQKADMDEMKKSLGSMGAAPVAPNAARIGTGSAEGDEGELKKSVPEIQEALQKAVQEGKVAASWLSNFGTYKDVNRLPPEVQEIVNA